LDTPLALATDCEPTDAAVEFTAEGERVGVDDVAAKETLTVAEAARRLGVSRARVYQLVASGALDAEGVTGSVRIAAASVQRRGIMSPQAGALLAPLSAWAILALASGDAAMLRHVVGLLSDPDRSRARSRLRQRGLVELLPHLRGRAIERGFVVGAEPLVDLLADSRVVLGGTSAARLLGWEFPSGTWPVEAYVAETDLDPLVDQYALERDDQAPDLLLRTVAEPWPFPPHARVVPAVVAALDLTEAADARLAAFGIDRIRQLSQDIVADWRQRPPRRRPVRPLVPTGTTIVDVRRRRHTAADDLIWDDRAEQDANQLVALLFVAATPLRRTVVAETLRISPGALLALVPSCRLTHRVACAWRNRVTSWGWCRHRSAPPLLGVISVSQRPSHCRSQHWTRWRSSPTSSPSLAPTSAPYAAWTATRWSRPFERADWLPRTLASAGEAGRHS